jgi:hypothetical protein
MEGTLILELAAINIVELPPPHALSMICLSRTEHLIATSRLERRRPALNKALGSAAQ